MLGMQKIGQVRRFNIAIQACFRYKQFSLKIQSPKRENPLMSDKLRCAVIGAGATGLDHLHSLLCSPRAAAVAIAENHAPRAREACERFKIPRSYVDYR